jgi:hypothetical protein
MLVPMAVIVSGCKTVLNLKYEPLPNPGNRLASVTPMKIKLLDFEDKREKAAKPEIIGKKAKKSGGKKGDVFSHKPCTEIIKEAIRTELSRNGHQVVDDNEDIIIKGEVNRFWVTLDLNRDQWDVMSRMDIHLNIINSSTGESTLLGPYHGGDGETTFDYPIDAILERALDAALGKLIKQVSSDVYLERALKGK